MKRPDRESGPPSGRGRATPRPSCLAGLLALLALSSCAGPRRKAECVAHRGQPWHRVETTHVRLRTDLGRSEGEAMARLVEGIRRAMLLWLSYEDLPGRIDLLVLASPDELEEFAPLGVQGFVRRSSEGQLIVLAAPRRIHGPLLSTRTVAHELAHHSRRWSCPRSPDG